MTLVPYLRYSEAFEPRNFPNKELSESSTTGMQVGATWKGWQDHAVTPARCTTGEPN